MVDTDPGASFNILPASGGNFTGNVLNPKVAGSFLVTGAYGGKNDSIMLTITRGAATQLMLTPSLATIPALRKRRWADKSIWDTK